MDSLLLLALLGAAAAFILAGAEAREWSLPVPRILYGLAVLGTVVAVGRFVTKIVVIFNRDAAACAASAGGAAL